MSHEPDLDVVFGKSDLLPIPSWNGIRSSLHIGNWKPNRCNSSTFRPNNFSMNQHCSTSSFSCPCMKEFLNRRRSFFIYDCDVHFFLQALWYHRYIGSICYPLKFHFSISERCNYIFHTFLFSEMLERFPYVEQNHFSWIFYWSYESFQPKCNP